MYRLKQLFVALAAGAVLAAGAATTASAGPPPYPSPGEPGCVGRDTADFAQDWKSFSFEPPVSHGSSSSTAGRTRPSGSE